MPITRLDNLLTSNSGTTLGRIVRHARDMGDMAHKLRSVLPETVQPHLLAANLREDGELVVICSSSTWAARLRFEAQVLLDVVRETRAHATRCTVRVGRPPEKPAGSREAER